MINKIYPWVNDQAQRATRLLDPLAQKSKPAFKWLIGETDEQFDDPKLRDFVSDADYAILSQDPVRARALIRTLFLLVILFIVWASFATVGQVTRGDGKVTPFSQVQVLQSLDGGIVSEILVREGATVERDQVLIRVDNTRFVSSVNESRAQYLTLLAKAARLRALAEQSEFKLPEEIIKEDPKTAEEERRLYESKKSELDTNLSISRQQLAQRQQELQELKAKQEQASKAFDLTNKELSFTKPLVATGSISEVELLRLERDVSRFRGDLDMAGAQISRVQAAISESTHKVQEVETSFRNDARKELNETEGKLNSLTAGSTALSDKVKHSEIRSPVKGTVKRLLVNTVGGVVQPGKDVIEIVPLEDILILEAKIQPKDIAFLRPGLKAMVKFNAYDFTIYGGLEGTLEQIGADTVVDEKGNAFYVVRVRTNKSSLGKGLPIMTGMVAEVDIMTGEKTILSYLLKPVLRAKSHALTER
jgi:adhesin transport system membrane fusion protein